ncbi:MAG TPA: hypothetical protein VLV50_01570 [Stellaceae bacterium]|nr:hypothetical protein [Stellaceae bacterium]
MAWLTDTFGPYGHGRWRFARKLNLPVVVFRDEADASAYERRWVAQQNA